jgi:hypothetical protein
VFWVGTLFLAIAVIAVSGMPSLAYSRWAWVAVVQRLLLSRISRATQKTMRKTKFLVKVVHGARAAEYVQRSDRNPVQTTLKRNLALAIARWTGEDVVSCLGNSRRNQSSCRSTSASRTTVPVESGPGNNCFPATSCSLRDYVNITETARHTNSLDIEAKWWRNHEYRDHLEAAAKR